MRGKRLQFFILCGFYKGKSWKVSKFTLKLSVYIEFLNSGNLLVAANLDIANKIAARPLIKSVINGVKTGVEARLMEKRELTALSTSVSLEAAFENESNF